MRFTWDATIEGRSFWCDADIQQYMLTNPMAVLGINARPGGFDGSTAQLVQTIAGFGGGSGTADGLNTAALGADTSQQPSLTTPQHA